jgi:hypothetical protein
MESGAICTFLAFPETVTATPLIIKLYVSILPVAGSFWKSVLRDFLEGKAIFSVLGLRPLFVGATGAPSRFKRVLKL